MKTINEILDNYNEYKTFLEDRFGKRFCNFLTKEEMSKIGFTTTKKNHKPLKWTEKNILAQLKEDVIFGYDKAINQRGISSSLMCSVVFSWCKVLENGLEDEGRLDYGVSFFQKVADFYDWRLNNYVL